MVVLRRNWGMKMNRMFFLFLIVFIVIALQGCVNNSVKSEEKVVDNTEKVTPLSEITIKQNLLKEYGDSNAVLLKVKKQIKESEGATSFYPASLVVATDSSIYISDNRGHSIYEIKPENLFSQKISKMRERKQLSYPNTIQILFDEIVISDDDGIKFFGRDGSLNRLLRTYYTNFHFTLDPQGNIYANPIFLDSKDTNPLIVKFDKQGKLTGKIGERFNRQNHNGVEDQAYLCYADGLLFAAFKHLPIVRIYDSNDGKLLRELTIAHPIFEELRKLGEDENFVRSKAGAVTLPKFIAGAKIIRNKFYILLDLPFPEIIEFNLEGQELERHRAEELSSATNYFGFDVRQTGNAHFFTVGFSDQQNPVFVELISKTAVQKK